MPEPLSTQERQVLDYLVAYVRHHTYQPSIREIGAEFDIKSTKTVSEVLQSLADKGWIERDSSRSRGVRLLGLDLEADVVSVPHVDVHLGDPSLADPIDHLALDRRIAGTNGCFMVSMVGDAMVAAGIRDGDLLVVEPTPMPEAGEGDLLAARVAGEVVVLRARLDHGAVWLESERADLPARPMESWADAQLLGRIVAVVRRLRTDAPVQEAPAERAGEGAVVT